MSRSERMRYGKSAMISVLLMTGRSHRISLLMCNDKDNLSGQNCRISIYVAEVKQSKHPAARIPKMH